MLTNRQTDKQINRQTHRTTTVTLAAHAPRVNNNCSDPVGISMYVQTIEKKHRTSSTSVRVGKVHLKVHNEDALDRLFPEDRIGSSESAAMSRDSS